MSQPADETIAEQEPTADDAKQQKEFDAAFSSSGDKKEDKTPEKEEKKDVPGKTDSDSKAADGDDKARKDSVEGGAGEKGKPADGEKVGEESGKDKSSDGDAKSDTAADGKTEESGDKAAGDGDSEKDEKAEDAKPKEKLTAQAILERKAIESAAKELEPEDEGGGEKKEGEKKEEPEDKGLKEEKPPELSAEIKTVLAMPELASVVIDAGEKKQPLSEFAAQYPEVTQQAIHIGRAMAKEAMVPVHQEIGVLRQELENANFKAGILSKHSDAITIVNSKGYTEWLGKQNKLVQKMDSTFDVEDAGAVIDAYKEHVVKSAKDKKGATAGAKKEEEDDVLKESLTAKKTVKTEAGSEKDEKEEFSEAFNSK